MSDDFELVEGSGNVFRDFGDSDADLKQVKAIQCAQGGGYDRPRCSGLLANPECPISARSRSTI